MLTKPSISDSLARARVKRREYQPCLVATQRGTLVPQIESLKSIEMKFKVGRLMFVKKLRTPLLTKFVNAQRSRLPFSFVCGAQKGLDKNLFSVVSDPCPRHLYIQS